LLGTHPDAFFEEVSRQVTRTYFMNLGLSAAPVPVLAPARILASH
jgi:hypothetical protein